MMIQKLEEELEVKIFDRSKQPVVPTKEGEEIIQRAVKILAEIKELRDFAKELKGEISGELNLGIIPTLAPYLLPLFLKSFTGKYPHLKIFIKEMITDEIIDKLKKGEIDIGILATPLSDRRITEIPLFYEEFYAYASKKEKLPRKKYLLPKEIDLNHLWLLEEGHCLRNQVLNLCELRKKDSENINLHYESGSIETLINIVDRHEGITIIPRLAVLNLKKDQLENVRQFSDPKPVREISLAVKSDFPRKMLLKHLKEEIIKNIPAEGKIKNKNILDI
jgi:LysR family hydrogen peroxide-inducible transcriptional activator